MLFSLVCTSCASTPKQLSTTHPAGYDVNDMLIGACRLPPKLVGLGITSKIIGPRKLIMASGVECGVRGGEYVAYDPANLKTARQLWAVKANDNDPVAQNHLGEIYERGLGTEQDYQQAATWYRRAAEQGNSAAQFNLGKLYELGLGIEKNMAEALRWYAMASGVQGLMINPALQVEPQLVPANPNNSPVIRLLDPLVAYTRGITTVLTSQSATTQRVVGQVDSQAPLSRLTVNDIDTTFRNSGLFEAIIPLSAGSTTVNIEAQDSDGRQSQRTFRVKQGQAPSGSDGFGQYHALIIGIQRYPLLNPLRTPIKDARVVAQMLAERYGFRVQLLEDATRSDILSALNTLRYQLTVDDNLLIYYAGHGELDELNDRGHWLPIDAAPNDMTNWLPNIAITDMLNHMKARSVLVVSDSCYAGALLRSKSTSLDINVQLRRSKRARTAITSGGLAPVLDSGKNGHSVFANAFIGALSSNEQILDAQQLLLQIRAKVTASASEHYVEQGPLHGAINQAGHENGSFFFVRQTGGYVADISTAGNI